MRKMKQVIPVRENTLRRDEAAQYLGVSVPTLARWASHGTGPHYYKIGRWARYRVPDLDQFVEQRRRKCARSG